LHYRGKANRGLRVLELADVPPYDAELVLDGKVVGRVTSAARRPDGAEVEIKRDPEKERLTLASGQSRFSLQTLAAEDFPDLAAGEFTHTFEIDAHDLKRLIDKTRFAISTEETRYYQWHLPACGGTGKSATLRAVAADGHRLARASCQSQGARSRSFCRARPARVDASLRTATTPSRWAFGSEGAFEVGPSLTSAERHLPRLRA
jgi:hypothetical protein